MGTLKKEIKHSIKEKERLANLYEFNEAIKEGKFYNQDLKEKFLNTESYTFGQLQIDQLKMTEPTSPILKALL